MGGVDRIIEEYARNDGGLDKLIHLSLYKGLLPLKSSSTPKQCVSPTLKTAQSQTFMALGLNCLSIQDRG